MKKNVWFSDLFMFVPGMLSYILFMIVPILLCFYYAFFDWNGLNPVIHFIGFANFAEALRDKDFFHAMGVTLFMAVTATVVINCLGIFFAILLNVKGKITNFYRSVFFFPLLISAVAVGFIWKNILSYNGLLNHFLEPFGIEKIQFLGNATLAVLTITFVNVWQSTGFVIIIYLAGLQTIPKELYDAADIDGVTPWRRFKHVTFPLLAPSLTMNIIFIFTGTMREYDRVAVLTTGGPAQASETIAYQIVRLAFNANRFSYASSMAVFMLILVGILAVTLTMLLRRREESIQ